MRAISRFHDVTLEDVCDEVQNCIEYQAGFNIDIGELPTLPQVRHLLTSHHLLFLFHTFLASTDPFVPMSALTLKWGNPKLDAGTRVDP
jgi:hypothetical protein